jgi:hypothetical protein
VARCRQRDPLAACEALPAPPSGLEPGLAVDAVHPLVIDVEPFAIDEGMQLPVAKPGPLGGVRLQSVTQLKGSSDPAVADSAMSTYSARSHGRPADSFPALASAPPPRAARWGLPLMGWSAPRIADDRRRMTGSTADLKPDAKKSGGVTPHQLIRTGPGDYPSWPGADTLHTQAGYIVADRPSGPASPLQTGGGPYIFCHPLSAPGCRAFARRRCATGGGSRPRAASAAASH